MSGAVRVLVVDDNDKLRAALVDLLGADAAIDVVGAAGDGVEAIEMCDQLQPDVVLMDIRMPRMDGIEATRRIRTTHDAVAVVAHTAYDDSELVADMVLAGAKGYLVKGVDATVLLDGITSAVTGAARVSQSVTRNLIDELEQAGTRERSGGDAVDALMLELRDRLDADPVTGLLAPHTFHAGAKTAAERAYGIDQATAVVTVEVAGLAAENTASGWDAGDALLRQAASALRSNVPSTSVVGRTSGSQLAAVVPGCGSGEARRLGEAVRRVAGEIDAEVHVGIATVGSQGGDGDRRAVAGSLAAALTSAVMAGRAYAGRIGVAEAVTGLDPEGLALASLVAELVAGGADDLASVYEVGRLTAALCEACGAAGDAAAAQIAALVYAAAVYATKRGLAGDLVEPSSAAMRLAAWIGGAQAEAALRGAARRWASGTDVGTVAAQAIVVALEYVAARLEGADRDTAVGRTRIRAGLTFAPDAAAVLAGCVAD